MNPHGHYCLVCGVRVRAVTVVKVWNSLIDQSTDLCQDCWLSALRLVREKVVSGRHVPEST